MPSRVVFAAARLVRTVEMAITNAASGARMISGTAQPRVVAGSKWNPPPALGLVAA